MNSPWGLTTLFSIVQDLARIRPTRFQVTDTEMFQMDRSLRRESYTNVSQIQMSELSNYILLHIIQTLPHIQL